MTTHVITGNRSTTGFFHSLIATTDTPIATFLRLTIAVAILPHGLQKVFGMFGGTTLADSLSFLTGFVGLPTPLAALVIALELLGPIALAVGAFSRVVAAGIIAIMIGAVWTLHFEHGFMMNWSGTAAGEGYEYHLLATAISAVVLVLGSGRYSIDRALQGTKS